MSEPIPLGIPKILRSVADALGAARNAGFLNIVIIGETDSGALMFSADMDGPLTRAETNYILDRGKKMVLDSNYDIAEVSS